MKNLTTLQRGAEGIVDVRYCRACIWFPCDDCYPVYKKKDRRKPKTCTQLEKCKRVPNGKIYELDYGSEAPTAIDLFCGCGGASLGLVKAGYNLLCGIDIGKDALRTYQHNLGNAIRADIRFLPLRENLQPFLVWGSPPCPGFSTLNIARHKERYQKQRMLLLWFAIAIEYLQPQRILFENIPNAKNYPEFYEMLRMLKFEIIMPYEITWKILDAADYGVPQHRRRIILVGARKDKFLGVLEMPYPPYFLPH